MSDERDYRVPPPRAEVDPARLPSRRSGGRHRAPEATVPEEIEERHLTAILRRLTADS